MHENVYASPAEVTEEHLQDAEKRKPSSVRRLAMIVFLVHLAPVLLICGAIVHGYLTKDHTGELHFMWIWGVIMDFPLSLLLFFVSGAGIGTAPLEWMGVEHRWWPLHDVIWPGVIFQTVGTLNWLGIVLVVRALRKRGRNGIGE